MNESKTKIVIASVLKPVDDVRNCEKIATSLAANVNYDITILGTEGDIVSNKSNIAFKSWKKFKRLSLKRIGVQFEFWKTLKVLKPQLIICTTFELLLVSVFFRIINRTKIIYDIQEDYLKNLWFQKFYPFGIRHIIGIGIRLLELTLSPFISGYTLAEKTYEKDINFVSRSYQILDNKSLPISRGIRGSHFKVIFTGTISTYSRAYESIELFLKISPQLPNSRLLVIGYVPNFTYLKMIELRFGKMDQIELKLSSKPVPHWKILNEISTAHLAIIGYVPNPVNKHKTPTKLFEYTAGQIPYLVQKDTHWAYVGGKLGGAIPIDLNQPNSTNIISEIDRVESRGFHKSGHLWSDNHNKLHKFIKQIID